jgi:hypothetical protein
MSTKEDDYLKFLFEMSEDFSVIPSFGVIPSFSAMTSSFSGGLPGLKCHFQQYFSYIVAVNFIGGGSQSARRKSLTCRK